MAEPVISTSKLRWATVTAGGPEVVEPDNTHKDNGWVSAEEPPHTFFNYWMNVVYLWLAYLDGLPAEAMTWTAAHIFQAGITVSTGAAVAATITQTSNQDGVLVTGQGNNAGKYAAHVKALAAQGGGANSVGFFAEADHAGQAGKFQNTTGYALTANASTTAFRADGTGATAADHGVIEAYLHSSGAGAAIMGFGQLNNTVGVAGIGGLSAAAGTPGGKGVAGNGGGNTASGGTGGYGGYFSGGLIALGGAGTGQGGTGVYAIGGPVFDSNNAALPGPGAEFWGGGILFDANGRIGGVGVKCQGGPGQAGYGPALQATIGDVNVLAGNVNVSAGNITVSGVGTFGSIFVEAVTAITYVNGWANIGGAAQTGAYWKDKQGTVWMRGLLNVAATTNGTITTLPAGYRPSATEYFDVFEATTNTMYRITVSTAGVVSYSGGLGVAGNISLSGIRFRV